MSRTSDLMGLGTPAAVATILGGIGGDTGITYSATPYLISADTADGADTKGFVIAGGATASSGRGAVIELYGNEHATKPAQLNVYTGDVAGAVLSLNAVNTTGVIRAVIGSGTIFDVKANGDISLDGTSGGNILFNRIGKGLQIKEGSNARMGRSTLSSGTVTVSNTSVTTNSRIFLTRAGVSTNAGFVYVSAQTASTSFVITSSNGSDAVDVNWFIMEPL